MWVCDRECFIFLRILVICVINLATVLSNPTDLGTTTGRCLLTQDPGKCDSFVQKWYYNKKTRSCEIFQYGGCGGNDNKFNSENECFHACTVGKAPAKRNTDNNLRCKQHVDIGTCQNYSRKWYFNKYREKCEVFIFGGCGGNDNRFESKYECENACLGGRYVPDTTTYGITSTSDSKDRCRIPFDAGPCKSYVHKWYFDPSTQNCQTFAYGGCEGNDNRFDTEFECRHFCLSDAYTLPPFVLKKLGIKPDVVTRVEETTKSTTALPTTTLKTSDGDVCMLERDHGDCQDYVHKWYFDPYTKSCNVFIFGGCGGNDNRFDSETQCLEQCSKHVEEKVEPTVPSIPEEETESTDKVQARLDICYQKPYKGACSDWVHKWYYNATDGECRTFIYGGCMGRENRFNTESECMHFCVGGPQYTLPPYLRKEFKDFSSEHRWVDGKWAKIGPTKPSVPISERGEELTFPDTGYQKTFMFRRNNSSFIQLDSNQIPTFQLRLCREISLQFRTKLPHGLLVYHSIKDRPEGLNPYALYVIVEKGQLKVVHVFGKHSTSVIVGEGLNRDTWHYVTVRIDVHNARLTAKVNDKTAETSIQGLSPYDNYGVKTDLTSVVLIGGLSPEEKLHGVKYIIESFVGCIKDVVLSAGKAALELLPIKPLIATKHENVREGCIDLCRTKSNLCFVGSRCINHYDNLTCDCFGTRYEGEHCDVYTATILTLRGSSYVSYRVYDWRDRVHSSVNRISLFFKTRYDDSVLFYASGEYANKPHHIAASIKNGSVILDIDFGDGPVITTLGSHVNSNHWNNLTIFHNGQEVWVLLDGEAKVLDAPGNLHHLYIDPEIYIGGGPELAKKTGLVSHNNFAGSLKYVFFNDISIIYELKKGNPKVHYIGVLDPEFYEADVEVIPVTFPFPTSHIWWENKKKESLNITFDFKSARTVGVLAYCAVATSTGQGFWMIKLQNDEVRFEVVPSYSNPNVTHVTTVKFDTRGSWHMVALSYYKGYVTLSVDFKQKETQLFAMQFQMGDKITIGGGGGQLGLVGCMRLIYINGEFIEPRYVVRTKHAVGDVSLDNCQIVDPCKRPDACEHGGKCSVDVDKVVCDCVGTGYIGKNCHFAEYRKTCEELALLGYTKPDVYLIDIDGNGRLPPAHVKCEFPSTEDTKTIVEHNLPSQVDVRSSSEEDFSFTIKYREFTAEMLQELISHSLYCKQHIKYDCYKAPLDLHSATWFISSAKNQTVDYIGQVKRGSCPCAVNKTCVNSLQSCNCDDISEAKWHSDEGYYTNANSLGIMEMVFLQQKELPSDGMGRITLGPLECVETNTQKYVVTFTTSQSYIEVPGWRKGDIAFSFRTTGEKAILLYQPPIRPNYPSFMVALTSDFQLTFNFTLNTGTSKGILIRSSRKLNGGEWQKVWIDYNEHHVRFMINTDYQMVDLQPEEEFGPFEGSMFIGGATEDLLRKSSVTQGLIGCFRGLVVNGEVLDIYSYMSVHLSEIIKDCKPTCDPNPCKNGAVCKELWSKYECVCENPWAYIGEHCETNINTKALTFVTPESYLKKNYIRNVPDEEKEVLKNLVNQNILINLRTYDQTSLVLYINDHLNNFIQLFVQDGKYVVFMFNDGYELKNITVDYPGVNDGKSIQIAVIRNETGTTLHVNDRNATVASSHKAIHTYSNRPWNNPEIEVLAPQRPPAPPSEYYQVNLGGYDSLNLIRKGGPELNGYVGCIRGLKIGNYLVDLPNQINEHENGVKAGCIMKCDEDPCKHQGICIEDFENGKHYCDCEHTSYYGESCNEEKGADFGGESLLQRQFVLKGEVETIKIQLAFSSSDIRQRNTVLLLLQTELKRSYYLLVGLTGEGHLVFEEDTEHGTAHGVRLIDRNFLNGARHSVYYQRNKDDAVLLIDREPVPLGQIPVLSMPEFSEGVNTANEVQIGGLNTSDPRFVSYKSYSGCLSNVLVEVNGYEMKPLEEYMLFTKTGSEKVHVRNSQGIRTAQCAVFDVINKPRPGPSLNISLGTDKAWVEDPPARVPYKSLYSDSSTVEEGAGKVVFIVLSSIFVMIILGAIYELWRTDRKYRRRKEIEENAQRIWNQSQHVSFPESGVKVVSFKKVNQNKPVRNGADRALMKNEYVPIPTMVTPPKPEPNGKLKTGEAEREAESEKLTESLEELSTNLKADPPSQNESDSDGEKEPNDQKGTLQTPRKIDTIPEEAAYSSELMKMGFRPGAGQLVRDQFPEVAVSPVFLTQERRNFGNPISYLGGPRLEASNQQRSSKESVLSLD